MPLLLPDLTARSAPEIDLAGLATRGIRGLIVDLDNTLLPRDTGVMPDAHVRWIRSAADHGLAVCLVSNNWHRIVREVAHEFGLPIVARAVKPLPFAFWRALAVIGLEAREVAVIGDQVFTDVLGGNLVGCLTILVEPLSSHDLPHTLVLRRLESLIMRGRYERTADRGGPNVP